jgi:hypothetical protein
MLNSAGIMSFDMIDKKYEIRISKSEAISNDRNSNYGNVLGFAH